MPDFRVSVELGHPVHDPCGRTHTHFETITSLLSGEEGQDLG